MPSTASTSGERKKSGRHPALTGCCVILPILLIGLSLLLYGYNNRLPDIKVPTPTMPNPNAYDDFIKAGLLAKGMQHKSPYSMPRPTFKFAEFEAAAKDGEPALAAMRQGLNRECMNPPVRSYNTIFPQYASFREVARVQNGVAMYYEMDGKPAKATEARLDGLEMGVMMPRGGPLIAGLVGVACQAIALSQFEGQLPLLSEAELAHVAARLDRIAAKRVSFADILQEEGYEQTAGDMELMKDPKGYRSFDAVRNLLAEDDPSTGQKKPLTLQQNWEAARFMFANKTAIIKENQAYNDALVAEAKRPYKVKSTVPVPNNLLAQMRGSIVPEGRARFVAMDAVQNLLRTEVALYRYQKATGHYPSTLTALTPTYITREAMEDPFSGTLLRYHPPKNGQPLQLYSIGPDQKDDLGTPAQHVGNIPGDIVAGKLWPRHTFKK